MLSILILVIDTADRGTTISKDGPFLPEYFHLLEVPVPAAGSSSHGCCSTPYYGQTGTDGGQV